MKKEYKRKVAALCAIVLAMGSIFTGMSSVTKAEDVHESVIWTGVDKELVTSEKKIYYADNTFEVQAPTGVDEHKNLGLSMSFRVADVGTLNAMRNCVVELTQGGTCDQAEFEWKLSNYDLTVGMNEICLRFADATYLIGTKGTPVDLAKPFNYFRIWESGSKEATSAILTDLKIVDLTEAGIKFGNSDDYLQLNTKLSDVPKTVEASVKKEGMLKEWTVAGIGEIMTGNSSQGVTSAGDLPGEGVSYIEATVGTGLQYIIGTNGKGLAIEAPDFGTYQKEDLALTFWYYSDSDGTLPAGGQIELGSLTDTCDDGEISYNTDAIRVNAGWNRIELPLSKFNEAAPTTGYDLQNTVRVRWFSVAQSAYHFKVTDFKIEVMKNQAGWTIAEIDQIAGSKAGYTKAVTTAGEAPGEGVPYVEATVNGNGVVISGTGKGIEIEAPNFNNYQLEELALTFWYYSDTAGSLPAYGQIELASDATQTESKEANWMTQNIYVNAGWNYIQLPLSQFNNESGYDYTNTVRVRWYFNSVENYHFKLTELKIEVIEDAKYPAWIVASASSCSGGVITTERGENGPDATWNVAEVSTKGEQQHIRLTEVKTPNFGNYNLENLSLAFWYYSYESSATKLPAGQIEISSDSKANDAHELFWEAGEISVEPGWNYVELPLAAYRGMGSDGFDLSKLCFVRWYRNTSDSEWKFKVSDMKIVVNDVAKYEKLGKLWDNNGTRGVFNQTWIKTSKSSLVFPVNGTSYTVNAGQYQKSQLAVAFWFCSSVSGPLAPGQIEISSSGKCDSQELNWEPKNISVKTGWNYIVLPLKDATPAGGEIDLTSINHIRWYFDIGQISASSIQYSIAPEISLVVIDTTDATENKETDIIVTENVVADSVEGYMVLSNLCENETTPYALFITKEGYPSLLWGTTQYTLQMNVGTGDWVDLAVTCDTTNNTLSFYVDGQLAKSVQTTFGTLGEFKTAHCIGADGSGTRMMKGMIADVRVWSDVRTADEIANNRVEKQYNKTNAKLTATTEGLMGGWFLYGDKQDVLVPMDDAKGVNPAVFRGTRADDWYDYDTKEYSFLYDESGQANYWSLVFVPDIQNLVTGKSNCEDVWMNMANWISDNVTKENVKFVIGAGDSTWNNTDAEYQIAMKGIEKFDKQVPFSNLIGNHDYVWKVNYRDSSNYQKYFGTEYNENTSKAISKIEKGYFSDARAEDSASQNTVTTTENAYYRFTVGHTSWMILQLEYHPRKSVINWADDILKEYPNDNVILATHSYITGTGEYCGEWMNYLTDAASGDGSDYNATTEAIWTELKDNSNIKMILCGHASSDTGAITVREEVNDEGRIVKALMINAQDLDANETATKNTAYYTDRPLGMLSILRFSEDGSQVAVQYYSPTDDKSFNPLDSKKSTTRNTKNLTLEYGVEPYIQEYPGAKATVAPTANVPDGYIFGGWFTDKNCTLPLQGETDQTVYARFVHEKMLSVKAQVKLDQNHMLPTDVTDIRFVTTVDSLAYRAIGFEITIGNVTKMVGMDENGSYYVYNKLYAVGAGATATEETEYLTYTPYDNFDLQANYFKTYTVKNVGKDNYNLDITVTPYWITLDGTTVKGETVTRCVNDTLTVIGQ